ncbi:hypothetical protein GALMADRAFT_99443 [Galerina marginata CBS 339.88]|uniref:Cytochrome P450 n=1 Tax=Galerina marginata (strain CBS 339.88) TaxID=685588 RepID=A0A067T3C0_GALM3|nr:hypothetical protein GALMADRAFT_99443 [Galerina marginata CBS 339.88]
MSWCSIFAKVPPQVLALGFALILVLLGPGLFRRQQRLPPGPRGWPLIGNALGIPSKAPWKVYLQWSDEFQSDILSLRLPGAPLIILNSSKAVNDLLVKHSAVYSNRPQSTMLNLMGMSWVFGLMQYGEQWRLHRKLFHREFEIEGKTAVRIHELRSVRRLLQRLLTSKVNYSRDLQLTTGDTILSVTYGISVKTEDDYFIKLAESLVNALTEVARAPFLVDMFPVLRFLPHWLPGAGFQRKAKEWKRLGIETRTKPFTYVKTELAMGTAVPSVAAHFLGSIQEGDVETENSLCNILAEAYLGGAGATVGTLCSFTLAMALFPETQKKAQAAVDSILHGQRLPDFSDYGQIPYLDALVNEVLRWNPGAPLGLFHAASTDGYYDGYFIPKGSMLAPNVWAILHDETIYGPKSTDFIPERFLTEDGERNYNVPDPDAAFGFGRRICPGRVMGRELLWITAASILAVFDISNPVGRNGNALDPSAIEYTNSMSSRPPYFDCTFIRRTTIPETMIRDGVVD